MTDWSKLKVPELKQELKKRNLPLTGLKADLVARLAEAESAPTDQHEPEPDHEEERVDATKDAVEQSGVNLFHDERESRTTADQDDGHETVSMAQASPPIVDTTQAEVQLQPSVAISEDEARSVVVTTTTAPTDENAEPAGTGAPSLSQLPSVEPQEMVADNQKRKRRSQSPPPPGHDSLRKRARQDEHLPFTNEDANDGVTIKTTIEDAKWVESHNGADAPSLDKTEMKIECEGDDVVPQAVSVDNAEDESHSTAIKTTMEDVKWVEKHNGIDAPSLNDTEMAIEAEGNSVESKSMRVDTVEKGATPTGVETTVEDVRWIENHNGVDAPTVSDAETRTEAESNGIEPRCVLVVTSDTSVPTDFTSAVDESQEYPVDDPKQQDTPFARIQPEVDDRPNPTNPRGDETSVSRAKDSRFKGLFAAGQEQSMEMNGDTKTDTIDEEPERIIEPAIHSATSALYIREFMRPLNAGSLREYLTVLAAAPGMAVDAAVITDFFLDPIRTHAFVGFTSVAAASRVRSSIHGRVWPDERNRKPLWSDFIPSDKIVEWQEQETPADRPRGAGKKWEVVYEADSDGHVNAFLQEASMVPAMQRTSTLQQRASSPHSMQRRVSASRPEPVHTTQRVPGTSTLDELFKSTRATPILYYQPVSQALVDRRLESIHLATSKHYDGPTAVEEINRYTFEDGEALVDRGPEIFPGIRPPPRGGRSGGRGAPRGGFRGRGGDRGYDRGHDYGRERYDRGPDRYDRGPDRYGRYEDSRNDRYRDRRY